MGRLRARVLRTFLTRVHRWLGLAIALAVVVVGLTGALLPHQDLLRAALAPDVWLAQPPEPGSAPLSPLELVRRVEAATGGRVDFIPLAVDPGHSQSLFLRARAGQPPLGFDQVFADPYSGDIRARVRFADLRYGWINLPPLLVDVHYSLAAGPWGRRLLGGVALVWLLSALGGLLLSLPHGGHRRRWAAMWRVRRGAGAAVLLQDLHRLLGLCLCPLMLVFTVSALGFNLPELHGAALRSLGAQGLYRPIQNELPMPGEPMSRERAVRTGEALMAQAAKQRGFEVHAGSALSVRPAAQLYGYFAHTSLDGSTRRPATAVWFDAVSGEELAFVHPYGDTAADAFDRGTQLLHTASVGGLGYRLLVSLFGLLCAAMAVAGVLVWLRRLRRI